MTTEDFIAKYEVEFATTGVPHISAAKMRQFRTDIAAVVVAAVGNSTNFKFKGIYINGAKETDTYWVSGNIIWRTKQAFTSNTAPTINNAYWEKVTDYFPLEDIWPETYTTLGYTPTMAVDTQGKKRLRYKIDITGDLALSLTNAPAGKVQEVEFIIKAVSAGNVTLPALDKVFPSQHNHYVDTGKELILVAQYGGATYRWVYGNE